MKVHIEKKLYLEADDRQFILKQYNNKFDDKGNEGFKALGYFGNLSSAIKFIIKMKIKESTAATMDELITDVRRIEEWVHKICGEA